MAEKKVYPVVEIELDGPQVETPYQPLPQEQQNELDHEQEKVGGKLCATCLPLHQISLFLAVKICLLLPTDMPTSTEWYKLEVYYIYLRVSVFYTCSDLVIIVTF